MLDLEVVPERSLGNEQWEFILGELQSHFVHYFSRSSRMFILPRSVHLSLSITICCLSVFLMYFLIILRDAYCTMRADSQATMSCNQNCASYVQRGGMCTKVLDIIIIISSGTQCSINRLHFFVRLKSILSFLINVIPL